MPVCICILWSLPWEPDKISYVFYPLIYYDVLCSCLLSVFLPENTIPYLLCFASRQGIKKGRISIQKFLFCDTNSMTRFCYSIHQSPNFYKPFIHFPSIRFSYYLSYMPFSLAFFLSFRYNRYVLSCTFWFVFAFMKNTTPANHFMYIFILI